MIVTVRLLAFREGDLREVTLPVDEADLDQSQDVPSVLEAVFYWGQNDQQPQELPSVSMGDVAELWGKHYLCCAIGWKELEHEDYLEYLSLTKGNRMLKVMALSHENV